MTIRTRRERERAEREQLIVTAARKLAESEGWSAVTTRRLASEVEYSQPVLYSHFKGRDAIMAAVAVEGCGELATALRAARTAAKDERGALAALSRAYTDFARERPALYDAMFTHAVDLPFATPEALPRCTRPSTSCAWPSSRWPWTATIRSCSRRRTGRASMVWPR